MAQKTKTRSSWCFQHFSVFMYTVRYPLFPSWPANDYSLAPLFYPRLHLWKWQEMAFWCHLKSILKCTPLCLYVIACRFLQLKDVARRAATFRTEKPRTIRSLNCMWTHFAPWRRFYSTAWTTSSVLWERHEFPTACLFGQITNWFDPNVVGVTALVECITRVKINPQAWRETFFFTLSEKPRSV